MLERIVVVLIIYTLILAYDGPKLKKHSRREWYAYGAVMLAAAYLSIDYVLDRDWPDLHNLMDLFLTNPAERIVQFLKG